MQIEEIREKYPQYNDLSNEQLARALHGKYYADMPYEEYAQKIGLDVRRGTPQPSEDLPAWSTAENVKQTLSEVPGNLWKGAGEVAAGANAAAMFIPDTLTETVNLIPGVDIPTPSEAVESVTGFRPGQGGFVREGPARDIAEASGMTTIAAAGMVPAVGRNLARTPEAVAEALGIGSAPGLAGARQSGLIMSDAPSPAQAAEAVQEAVTTPGSGLNKQGLLRQQILQGDAEGAGFMLVDGRPVKDMIAKRAMDQGFDDSVIAMVKQAGPEDKAYMREMVKIRNRAIENARFGADNRATDVIGRNVMNRVSHVQRVNKEAGRAVGEAAKKLDTQPFNWEGAQQGFANLLDELGVTVTRTEAGAPKLDFAGSAVEGLGQQGSIRKLFNRISNNRDWSAKGAHDIKKFMDELIAWGRSPQGGLAGRTEGLLKDLRGQISSQLNDAFPEYGNANRVFSTTLEALDDFQKSMGGKVDLSSPQANKSTGQVLRGLISNNRGRVEMSDALNNLDAVANDPTIRVNLADRIEDLGATGGRRFTDDLLTQMTFADELDAVLGPSARTSLAGEAAKAVRQGEQVVNRNLKDMAIDKATETYMESRGINRRGAVKAINELLVRE